MGHIHFCASQNVCNLYSQSSKVSFTKPTAKVLPTGGISNCWYWLMLFLHETYDCPLSSIIHDRWNPACMPSAVKTMTVHNDLTEVCYDLIALSHAPSLHCKQWKCSYWQQYSSKSKWSLHVIYSYPKFFIKVTDSWHSMCKWYSSVGPTTNQMKLSTITYTIKIKILWMIQLAKID